MVQEGEVQKDKYGQYQLLHADREVRLHETNKEPFPLYPGEILVDKVLKLSVVKQDHAYRLTALEDFLDESVIPNVERRAGDEWFLEGPCTYYPRKEVDFVDSLCFSSSKSLDFFINSISESRAAFSRRNSASLSSWAASARSLACSTDASPSILAASALA